MNYDLLKKQLLLHEGFRQYPYKDTVGKLTIGIGRNLDDRGISMNESLVLLEFDVAEIVNYLSRYDWFNNLGDVRQRVVVDMVYNLGISGFLKFKRTIQAIKERDFDKAAEQMLKSKWAGQVGIRATRLARMMETGEDYD